MLGDLRNYTTHFLVRSPVIVALVLFSLPAYAVTPTSGIDTSGVNSLPFAINGGEIMTLSTTNGLVIDGGGLQVSGYTTTLGTLNAQATGLGSLNVTGATTLSGATISNAFTANGTVSLGTTTITGPVQVNGAATLQSTLSVASTITTQGSVTAQSYFHSSDVRLKTDVHPIANALDKILSIHGVQFSWKKDGRPDMGVIAQNVANVFPDVVSKNNDGMMAVEYDSLVGPMIESIRELKAENDALRQEVIAIKASLADMQKRNTVVQKIDDRNSINAYSNHSSVAAP